MNKLQQATVNLKRKMEVSYSIDIDTIDDNDSELLVFFRYEKIVFNRIKKKEKERIQFVFS